MRSELHLRNRRHCSEHLRDGRRNDGTEELEGKVKRHGAKTFYRCRALAMI